MRTTKGAARRKARKRLRKAAAGYWGRRKNQSRITKEAVRKARKYMWMHRRQKKRDFRSLWITRLTAAARMRGLNYSSLMAGLKRAKIRLNRKVLSDLAISDPAAFDKVVALARG